MDDVKTTDAAIIRASRSNPPEFGLIFDRYWPRIHRYCVGRAGPPGEDLAAETFRLAFMIRKRYDGRDDAAPWLYGIATNLLRGWARSTARGERALARSGAQTQVDETDDLLDRLDAERFGSDLVSVLATLSIDDRDALLLHALAGLTYEEIARAVAVPSGTVASRISRARARVRARLDSLELC
jgi:RNA polymerase sigma factor (sigma-70 family)